MHITCTKACIIIKQCNIVGIINKDNHFIYILRTNLNFSVAMADHADGEGLPPLVVRKICHKNENNYMRVLCHLV